MSLFQAWGQSLGGRYVLDQEPIAPIIMDDLDYGSGIYEGTDWTINFVYAESFRGTESYNNSPNFSSADYTFTASMAGRYWATDIVRTAENRTTKAIYTIGAKSYTFSQYSDVSHLQEVYAGVYDVAAGVGSLIHSNDDSSDSVFMVDGSRLQRVPDDSFVAVIKTTTADETFAMPLVDAPHDCWVDWGDGTRDRIIDWQQAEVTHTYGVAGVYQITLWGVCPTWYFNDGGDKDKLIAVLNIGDVFDTLENSFYGALNCVDAIPFKAGKITNCSYAWYNNNLTSFDASALTNVTSCSSAWRENSLTSFDASALTNVTDCSVAWEKNNLTSFDASALTNVTSCSYAWYNNNLTSFDALALTNVTSCFYAWRDNNLTTFDASALALVTNCSSAWRDNNLTTFDASALALVTNCSSAWERNNLTSFDASGLVNVTDCSWAWYDNSLDQSSVDGIINVLADNIKSPGFSVGLDGPNMSPPSAAAQLRIDNELIPAGYTVNHE